MTFSVLENKKKQPKNKLNERVGVKSRRKSIPLCAFNICRKRGEAHARCSPQLICEAGMECLRLHTLCAKEALGYGR